MPYDQLTDAVGPLATMPPDEVGIVLVETLWKPAQRRYHKQKLALLLTNLRHFALEQARRGVAVEHVAGSASYATLLEPIARARGPLLMMEAAERELRVDLDNLVSSGGIEVVPNETWLTRIDQFDEIFAGDRPWRMDRFYREIRRASKVLMKTASRSGASSASTPRIANAGPASPRHPLRPDSRRTRITLEVVDLVERTFRDHPGQLDPAARARHERRCRGPVAMGTGRVSADLRAYEDAMSVHSSGSSTRASRPS